MGRTLTSTFFLLLVFLCLGGCASSGLRIPSSTADTSPSVVYDLQTSEIKVDVAYLSINASYPVMVSRDKPLESSFNTLVNTIVNELIPDAAGQQELIEYGDGSSLGSTISLQYMFGMNSDEIISVGFYVDQYIAGAAHPNRFSKFLNFSITTKRDLQLQHVLAGQSRYLSMISSYCINEMKQVHDFSRCTDDEWLHQGAGPVSDNYKNILFTEAGMQVTFDEYVVAAYWCGSQQVLVPYSVLTPFIDPAGPLRRYAVVKKAGLSDDTANGP